MLKIDSNAHSTPQVFANTKFLQCKVFIHNRRNTNILEGCLEFASFHSSAYQTSTELAKNHPQSLVHLTKMPHPQVICLITLWPTGHQQITRLHKNTLVFEKFTLLKEKGKILQVAAM